MSSLHYASGLRVAIACGGTGGHLFPGLAVAEKLREKGCALTLLVSPKEIDQQAVKSAQGMEVVTLPAVGLTSRQVPAFIRGFRESYRSARKLFQQAPPQAVLAMGGFTSAPPLLAAKKLGAQSFLHESNTIPGRANRWLSWVVDRAFVGFPGAAKRLHTRAVTVTGTPVRPQFKPVDAAACRRSLGLEPTRPVVLVMGGSQGASGINDLVSRALPALSKTASELQWFHLTGPNDLNKVQKAYDALGLRATVHSFFSDMGLALGAASVAISRAGASSLAELAAMRLPAVLIPFPAATDNHQFYNAQGFVESGAAAMLEQRGATPEALMNLILELTGSAGTREKMQAALARWHSPRAAEEIAESMLSTLGVANECHPGDTSTPQGKNTKGTMLFRFGASVPKGIHTSNS
jgi:UDP-N-acetylglucosamine--N-acetylmuramyl-(pentapeptide) pyrophosphoryl-undecaprenol N-acetylglucosamine transferase